MDTRVLLERRTHRPSKRGFTMLRISTVMLFMLAVAPVTAVAQAQQSPPADTGTQTRPDIVQANVVVDRVTVDAVDHAKRTATLRAGDGQIFRVQVPDTVVNFPQVEKGDTVTIKYAQATAVFLRAPGATATAAEDSLPAAQQSQTIQVAPRGEKPAGVNTVVTQLTATVDAVDYANRKVTLKGPAGNKRTIDVGEEVKNLDRVKPGDQVDIRHTEALAIEITK
jgi:uncharacterized protein YraI